MEEWAPKIKIPNQDLRIALKIGLGKQTPKNKKF